MIHIDQGKEFENGLMGSLNLCSVGMKTRTTPHWPESDGNHGMLESFNRSCMSLSMFVDERRDNWDELLPFVAYRTSIHESTGYSRYHLMM